MQERTRFSLSGTSGSSRVLDVSLTEVELVGVTLLFGTTPALQPVKNGILGLHIFILVGAVHLLINNS